MEALTLPFTFKWCRKFLSVHLILLADSEYLRSYMAGQLIAARAMSNVLSSFSASCNTHSRQLQRKRLLLCSRLEDWSSVPRLCFSCVSFFRYFRRIAKTIIGFVMSVRPSVYPHGTTRLPLWTLMKLGIWRCFENLMRQFSCLKYDANNPYFHKHRYTFVITSRSVLLRMRNVLYRSCRENQTIHFLFSTFFPENCAVYEVVWKDVLEP